ncbi:MAG: VWA domain-containing protein [Rhodobacteraceae bacterium]|nr:VWA domain-containing protein [Paracoccaceae bacterium]
MPARSCTGRGALSMSDELKKLAAAMKAVTPASDDNARAAAILAAQKSYTRLQGSADTVRPIPEAPKKSVAFWRGLPDMIARINLKPALYISSCLVVAGAAFVTYQPWANRTPVLPEVTEELPTIVNPRVETSETDAIAQPAPVIMTPPSPKKVHPEQGAASSAMRRNDSAGMASAPVGSIALQKTRVYEPMSEKRNNDSFVGAAENPIKITTETPVSTFSIDVDTASYGYIRNAILEGRLPEFDAVRIEEMVNYFPYDYAAPEISKAPFSTAVSVIPTPWNSDTQLVHIAIQGAKPAIDTRSPLNLVFLIDTSGSMQDSNKLPLLKQSFRLLLSELRPEDQVAIVTYAGSAGVVLEPTKASDRSAILDSLNRLSAGGSTAGQAGLQQAYALAEQMGKDTEIGRVLLATDGDFNIGISDPEALKAFVERKRDSGIYLSVFGFGQGNYRDDMMQSLAQNGNGTASYIDTLAEAQKVLVDQVSAALFPIANDVKIQVEFNPAQVAEYRLIGYETRVLNREDFNNDRVDAGEIGAGHAVTALYEITPVGSSALRSDPLRYQTKTSIKPSDSNELGFVKLRYKTPGEMTSKLLSMPIVPGTATPNQDASFAAAIAGFGQLLKGSDYTGDWSLSDAATLAHANLSLIHI